MATRKISYSDAINEALAQEMERDQSVILMGEDVAGGAGGQGDDALAERLRQSRFSSALPPRFGPIRLLVAFEVAVVAGQLALDQRRPAALAGTLDRLAGRLVDGEEVDAVDDDARACRSRRRGRRCCPPRPRRSTRWPRRSRCSRRRRSPAGSTPPARFMPRGWCPGWSAPSPKNATATPLVAA